MDVQRQHSATPMSRSPEVTAAMIGRNIRPAEGPDCGGPFAPYNQSDRLPLYRAALDKLQARGLIYPCTCSRKDIRAAAREYRLR